MYHCNLTLDLPDKYIKKKKKRWTAETRMGAGGIFLYLLQGIELKTKLIKVIHRGT